jgi:5-methyltetrahydrofolate--homocysteine methyltransferase
VSAQQEQARETLAAVHEVRHRLGLQTVLGVSNISFGLPNRPLITQSFLTQAMAFGLTLPIINPNQTEMLDAVAAHRVLSGEDAGSGAFIARFAAQPAHIAAKTADETLTLQQAIMRGLQDDAGRLAKAMLPDMQPLTIVQEHLIPALDRVGEDYEKGVLFLPQLLSAAQAAQAVFEVIRVAIAKSGGESVKKGKLVIATVHGDVHDIGKNIVRTVLENYGYDVIDLGRDVPAETIRETVERENVRLVGLSALMTTTLPAMEETIRLLHTLPNPPKIMVGGAVVTPEYTEYMQADYYARDARQAVEIAKEVLG